MSREGKEAARIAVHPPELGHIDVDIDIAQSGSLRRILMLKARV